MLKLKRKSFQLSALAAATTTLSGVLPAEYGPAVGYKIIAGPGSEAFLFSTATLLINGTEILKDATLQLYNQATEPDFPVIPLIGVAENSPFRLVIVNTSGSAIITAIEFFFNEVI